MCNITNNKNMSAIQTKSILKSTEGGLTSEKKQVQWQGSCRVRPFIMVDENQRESVWYSSNDYREFKKERKAAATLAKNMGIEALEETNFVSCRGIEYMIDDERLANKFEMQHSAAAAVLKAQFKMFKKADLLNETPDLASSEVIAFEYKKLSRQAHFEASQRALQQWKSSQLAEDEEEEIPAPQDAMGKPISIEFPKKGSKGKKSDKYALKNHNCSTDEPRRSNLRKAMSATTVSSR
mmetsp:Transcript_11667/g.18349  ORF Transcript_11667/g.18349 Transcript_11667/m.18349 type:complete len:238 (-) Transcript_11667:66-779(-)